MTVLSTLFAQYSTYYPFIWHAYFTYLVVVRENIPMLDRYIPVAGRAIPVADLSVPMLSDLFLSLTQLFL
jgi:hypothetical protein